MIDVQLTLIVTAHRVEHLRESMMSVTAQTTDQFELVCCADKTGEDGVVAVFAELSPPVRCHAVRVLSVPGGTAGRVRNAAFSASRTPWVAYLDGDDVLRPDALERLLCVIQRGDADIISAGMWRISQDGRPCPIPASLTYRPPLWIYQIDPEAVGHPTYFNQLLAIRRDLWLSYPFYEETNGEDIDFMLHQLLIGRFQKLPLALYGYRDVAESFSKHEFPEADLCTLRYQAGYYSRLFADRYLPQFENNFSNEVNPLTPI